MKMAATPNSRLKRAGRLEVTGKSGSKENELMDGDSTGVVMSKLLVIIV